MFAVTRRSRAFYFSTRLALPDIAIIIFHKPARARARARLTMTAAVTVMVGNGNPVRVAEVGRSAPYAHARLAIIIDPR